MSATELFCAAPSQQRLRRSSDSVAAPSQQRCAQHQLRRSSISCVADATRRMSATELVCASPSQQRLRRSSVVAATPSQLRRSSAARTMSGRRGSRKSSPFRWENLLPKTGGHHHDTTLFFRIILPKELRPLPCSGFFFLGY